jgi:hypothetical protein
MPKILQLFLLSLICFSACKKKPENIMADIVKHYKEINSKQKEYTQKQVDDITSRAGGTIIGYYRDEEIKEIISQHFTDTCRTFTEYYFDDGMLIFILKENYIYNKPASYTEEKAREKGDSAWYDDRKTRLEISRFYFNKNKLIKWVAPNNQEIPDNTWTFTNQESILWAETLVLMKELKEQ